MPCNTGSRADGHRRCRAVPPLTAITLLRHDVAFNMKLFPSKLEAEPPVPPVNLGA